LNRYEIFGPLAGLPLPNAQFVAQYGSRYKGCNPRL